MGKRTTLTDIAQAVGVTPSTVQRALSDTPGVSEEKRQEIKCVASQMGYRGNAMAKMLQKQGLTIAVILPEPAYYSQRLWDGAERCLSENAGFDIVCHRFTYARSPENLAAALETVWNELGTGFDGVLTMGEPDEQVHTVCRRWLEHQVPVVWVGTDADPTGRLCCCCGVSGMAGSMAADLLLLGARADQPMKVLLTGDFSISDQYADMQGFEQVLMQNGGVFEIIKLSGRMSDEQMRQMLYDRLMSENINAIFSTSARNTVSMCHAVERAGLIEQIKLIGSDLFPQSQELLLAGKLNAVIDKRPGWQAYNAMQILLNHILWKSQPESAVYHAPSVVTRSNVEHIDIL